jgi:hypothetical protein
MLLSRYAILFIALLMATAIGADEGDEYQGPPLFQNNDLLEVKITAPFGKIMRERSKDDEEPGTITYRNDSGDDITLNIDIRTRGNFRHQEDICPFAPLRLNFSKTKGTLFAKSNKLKLVTHCRNDTERYRQALLSEYLAYRILNTLTDKSFRVRLLKVRYVESTSGKTVDDNYAFLIEHRDQLGKRIGLKHNPTESTWIGNLVPEHTNLVSLFQYLIGNTDFSPIRAEEGEPCCHNYVLMGDEPGKMLSIPYDFDLSGIVSVPYAKPNPRFRLRNVRQRLYRGRCMYNDYLPVSVHVFQEKRQAIYGLVDSVPGYSSESARKTVDYIDDFYKIIDSEKQIEKQLKSACH